MRYRHCARTRPVRKRFLILCEGGKTEPNYFNAIKSDKFRNNNRLSGLRIVVHDSKKNTAKELVAGAIQLKHDAIREKNPYDEIWIVVDRDGYTKHPESFNRAKAKNIQIAFSSPCFELWYYLHFQYSTAQVNNGDAMCSRLEEFIPNYDKAESYYEKLNELTDTAIGNCNKIIKHWEDVANEPIWNLNPYTNVGILVEKLYSL